MSDIKSFKYSKDEFDKIRQYRFGTNWPVVYIAENGNEAYIGETINAYNRSKQHYDNPDRRRLTSIHILSDDEFNKSAALDIESWLIQYMSADEVFLMQNSNAGLQNHNYFDREKYKAKFELTWNKFIELGLAKHTLSELRNSDLFKYSPYKSLNEDQLVVAKSIYDDLVQGSTSTFMVTGRPGTGKTVLATYLFKYLKEQRETQNWNMALIVPMSSLRQTIKKVFSKIKSLSANMVIGPSDVVKSDYDLVLVDEAHRLRRRRNIVNYASFDATNASLGLGNEGTELDWIKLSSNKSVLFYDQLQSIKPSDVRPDDFSKLQAKQYTLKTQMRVGAGDEFLKFIDDLFDLRSPTKKEFQNFDFRVFDDLNHMFNEIKQKDQKMGLSRMVAGYAWPWHTAQGTKEYDIEIGGYRAAWNSTSTDWVNSANAINEVGCIHTVQGYDLNYVGVIIGPEFKYDPARHKFIVDQQQYFDRNGRAGIQDPKELEQYIINIYKTLITRGIHGVYLYICDPQLKRYIKSCTSKPSLIDYLVNYEK